MKKSKKIFISIIVLGVLLFLYAFYDCLVYELHHAYNYDTCLYWAVGRGILNGITPYSGLYENKPLGIFILSAINFLFTDGTIVCNIISLIALLSIAFMPIFIFREILKSEKKNYFNYSISILFLFLAGIFFMMYSEKKAGGFQVEAIGASYSLYYIWAVIRLKNASNKKETIIRTILSAIFIQMVVFMKEPFLLIVIASVLLFIDNFKDFIKCFLIPSVIGGISYLLILLVTKILKPYLSIYIMHMFSTRLGGEESAFERMFKFWYLLVDLSKFNILLSVFLVMLSFFAIVGFMYYKKKNLKIYHIIRVILLFFITSFCVGLGGQYFDHHFIFAVPAYLSLMIYGAYILYKLFDIDDIYKKGSIVFLIILIPSLVITANSSYEGDYSFKYAVTKSHAEYVDRLLDHYGEDNYQYIGFNGEDTFFGLTKHSPKGPVFVQDKENFYEDDNWFAREFLKQLDEVNIIIFKTCYTSSVRRELTNILNNDFTVVAPDKFEEAPQYFNYIVLYRRDFYKKIPV